MLDIITIPVLQDNYNYLIHDRRTGDTAVIDPSLSQPVLEVLEEKGWRLTHILNTHHHGDHTGGNIKLKSKTGCKIFGFGPDAKRIPGIDIRLSDKESFSFGAEEVLVHHVPGHTTGHIFYHFPREQIAFVGDTLFVMGCGRLFEGTPQQMIKSLSKIVSLAPETKLYNAHEYALKNGEFALTVEPENEELKKRVAKIRKLRERGEFIQPTTVADEMATNPFVRTKDPSKFAEIRQARNGW